MDPFSSSSSASTLPISIHSSFFFSSSSQPTHQSGVCFHSHELTFWIMFCPPSLFYFDTTPGLIGEGEITTRFPNAWDKASMEYKEAAAAARNLAQEIPQSPEVHCSRERSRAAWKIIEEYLMPFVEQEQYQISKSCRLHPDNDMFREQEQHKIHHDINEWRCGFCRKSFRAEKFLDQHFHNRHNNLLNDTQGRCLADLCGALHCDVTMESKLPKRKCNPAAAARNHHLCESLADNCFPINEGHSASRLHEFFLRQFCDAHTCTGKQKPFPRGAKKETSVFFLAISILILMLLPIFYVLVYLYRREMKTGVQDLKRISQTGRKSKPS